MFAGWRAALRCSVPSADLAGWLQRCCAALQDSALRRTAPCVQGVCNGLKEVMENATRTQLADHLADLLLPIQVGAAPRRAGPPARLLSRGCRLLLCPSG